MVDSSQLSLAKHDYNQLLNICRMHRLPKWSCLTRIEALCALPTQSRPGQVHSLCGQGTVVCLRRTTAVTGF